MTAGLRLSLGILPAFAWVLGLVLKGRAFCKAFGMCSELKCFFCLTIGWKTNKKTKADINYDLHAFKTCIKSSRWIVKFFHKIGNTRICWQSEIRIQSYIKHGLPRKACITLGKTEKYTEYLQFFQELKCAYFYNMDDGNLHRAVKKIQSLLKWKILALSGKHWGGFSSWTRIISLFIFTMSLSGPQDIVLPQSQCPHLILTERLNFVLFLMEGQLQNWDLNNKWRQCKLYIQILK